MKLFLLTLPFLLLANVGGFVRDGAAEIIFPAAIRFTLNLTIPASEIASATLTLTSDGRDPLVIPVDLDSAVLNPDAPTADLAYLWTIPIGDPPPLFGQIEYSWSLTSADGSTGTFSDSFVYADPHVEWARTIDPTGRFSLTASRALALDPSSLRQVYDLLHRNTGSSPSYNLLIDETSSYCRRRDDGTSFVRGDQSGVIVDCADRIEAAVFAGYDRLVIPAGADGESFVVALLVDAAYASLWQGKSVPAWFVAGLEQFYDPADKNALLLPVQQASRQRTLYSRSALESPQDEALWQAQSYALILYVVDQVGVSGLVDLAHVDADDFAAAYQQAVGQPLVGTLPGALAVGVHPRRRVCVWHHALPIADRHPDGDANVAANPASHRHAAAYADDHAHADVDAARHSHLRRAAVRNPFGDADAASANCDAASSGQLAHADADPVGAASRGVSARCSGGVGHVSAFIASAARFLVHSIGK